MMKFNFSLSSILVLLVVVVVGMTTVASVHGFAFVGQQRRQPSSFQQSSSSLSSSSSPASAFIKSPSSSSIIKKEKDDSQDTISLAYQSLADLSSSLSSSSKNVKVEQNPWDTLAQFSTNDAVDHNNNNLLDFTITTADVSETASSTSLPLQNFIEDVKITDDHVELDAFGMISTSTTTPTSTTSTDDANDTDLSSQKHIQYPGYRDIMFQYTKESDVVAASAEQEDGDAATDAATHAMMMMDIFYTQGAKVVPLNANDDGMDHEDGIIIMDNDSNEPSSSSSSYFQ